MTRHAESPSSGGAERLHFGVRVPAGKAGYTMTRDFFAYPRRGVKERLPRHLFTDVQWNERAWMFQDEAHSRSSDMFLLVNRDAALRNYDLSLSYFASLDADDFEDALETVMAAGRSLRPVESLREWEGVAGAYVMVFDKYRQFYVGQSSDISRRIRQHWTKSKPFDRVLFGSVYDSIFPVDELRALDTTRIFAARTSNPTGVEQRAEASADRRFCLNRMAGGAVTPVALMLAGAIPRSREHGVVAQPSTKTEFAQACSEVTDAIADARSGALSDLVGALASMDMTIFAMPRDGSSPHIWSRRDLIASAAARGELTVEVFAGFLSAMGERIVWPDRD